MKSNNTPKKSDITRLAMIEAAIDVFGKEGYHAASNRSLSNAAGVNMALISYHFGGKEGLYLAVFEHIIEQMGHRINPVFQNIKQDLEAITGSQLSKKKQLATCQRILETILFTLIEMLSSQQTEPWARLVLREQQDPGKAFDILYTGPFGNVLQTITMVIAAARDKANSEPEIKFLALNLMAQVIILRAARATVLRHMGWKDISHKQIDLIKNQISTNIKTLIRGGN